MSVIVEPQSHSPTSAQLDSPNARPRAERSEEARQASETRFASARRAARVQRAHSWRAAVVTVVGIAAPWDVVGHEAEHVRGVCWRAATSCASVARIGGPRPSGRICATCRARHSAAAIMDPLIAVGIDVSRWPIDPSASWGPCAIDAVAMSPRSTRWRSSIGRVSRHRRRPAVKMRSSPCYRRRLQGDLSAFAKLGRLVHSPEFADIAESAK